MSIDIVHLCWLDLTVFQCPFHGEIRSAAVLAWCGHVVRIPAAAVTTNLSVDVCTSRLRMLKLFENTYGSTFTHDEAIAVCVEGAATGWWVVVIGRRERTGPSEAGKCERMDAGLGATGDHNVGIPESNEARCIANRVSTRG